MTKKTNMSNKNTPISNRINKFCTRNINGSATPTQKNSNSNEIRRRNAARNNLNERNYKSTPQKEDSSVGVLNTAFRASQLPVPTNTVQNSVGSTPRLKTKPTVLNACYTPSSLYRNMKSTPGTGGQLRRRKTEKNEKNGLQDSDTGEASNLTVAVRVRPLNAIECLRSNVSNIVRVHGDELTVLAGSSADTSSGVTHSFNYDHVFYSCDPKNRRYADQQTVFNATALPLIERAFEGYNACLFAYGQTGSGKSYSMMGIEALDDAALDGHVPHPEAGIIPRFCHEIFRRIEAVKNRLHAEIEVSYFEIYNEKIHDLLSVAQAETHYGCNVTNTHGNNVGTPLAHKPALKVREHPIWGPYVVDLSIHPVDSYEALRNWLAVGNSQRATAATGMNDKSSRSHSIFNIVLNLTDVSESGSSSPISSSSGSAEGSDGVTKNKLLRQTRRSKISLVDLAGSERISSSANGDRVREGVSINKSLLTLGKVIAALSEARKNSSNFVPYRESVLTWLLRENLGGNSRTVMLATISPASLHVDETLATLRYACQARSIVNRVKVNESPHDRIIRELRSEVERLKSLRNEYERQRRFSGNSNPTPRKIIIETSVDESEVEALRQQLSQRERELERAQKSWMERLREAEDQRKSEMSLLRRKGLALELSVEHKQACLVNLTADPILSGTLFYLLPTGKVKVGRTRSAYYATQPDIVLEGPLVARQHCVIENDSEKLFITPQDEDFETYLNGELVCNRQQMFHGDRLVIGGSHYFRISNPFCKKGEKSEVVDFQLAHQEILQKQEEKLRCELEEEKRAALSRIEMERLENEKNFQQRLEKLELEQLKYECNLELLETERQAFEAENARRLSSDLADSATSTPAFKSTSKLLDDINNIMQTPSEESLHKTQLMVKEATQLCRSFGLKFEFRHSQVLDEVGLFRTVILILDKMNDKKAEWPVARLAVWLDIIRDTQNVGAENIFSSVDIEWKEIDNELNETLSDTTNSSRISLNLSIVKDILQRSPRVLRNFSSPKSPSTSSSNSGSSGNFSARKQKQHLAKAALLNCASPLPRQTNKFLTYDEEDGEHEVLKKSIKNTEKSPKSAEFITLATTHVKDMQRSALRLKRLCEKANHEQENQLPMQRFNSVTQEYSIRESLSRLEDILYDMRAYLEQSALITNSVSTPKSVRFLID